EGGDARKRLPFQHLEGGAAPGGDVGELVLEPGHGRGRIPASHDRRGAALPRLDQRLSDGTGPLVERRRLEHAHRAVPEDGLGLQDPGPEVEPGGAIDVEDGAVGGDAIAPPLRAPRRTVAWGGRAPHRGSEAPSPSENRSRRAGGGAPPLPWRRAPDGPSRTRRSRRSRPARRASGRTPRRWPLPPARSACSRP